MTCRPSGRGSLSLAILDTGLDVQTGDHDGNGKGLPAATASRKVGPRVQVSLTPLESHSRPIADKGGTTPAVPGRALMDTGAAVTRVDAAAVAQQAGC